MQNPLAWRHVLLYVWEKERKKLNQRIEKQFKKAALRGCDMGSFLGLWRSVIPTKLYAVQDYEAGKGSLTGQVVEYAVFWFGLAFKRMIWSLNVADLASWRRKM